MTSRQPAYVLFALLLTTIQGPGTAQNAKTQPFGDPVPLPVRVDGERLRIPLTVKDWTNVVHDQSPVTSGVPLPMGAVPTVDRLQITTGEGKAIAVQFRPLAWWPDKSIRWVLCDFQANVDAGSSSQYFLVSGEAVQANASLPIQETKEAIIVDTGAMKFAISKLRQTLVEQVVLAGKPVVNATHTKEPGFIVDGESVAAPPENVVVEEKGPLRVVVRVDGALKLPGGKPGPTYSARVCAYRNKTYLRIHLVLKNHSTSVNFGELRLRTRLENASGMSYVFGGQVEVKKGPLGKEERYTIDHTGALKSQGKGDSLLKQPLGWCDLSGPDGGVTLGLAYFSEDAPKALEVAANGTADLVFFPKQPKNHVFRGGLHKTQEFFLNFHPPAASDAALKDTITALRYPLHATAPATWYRDTMAVPGMFLSVADPQRWPSYERSVSGFNNWKPGQSPVRHGVGNWEKFGVKGWDDIDTPYGEVIQYLRFPDHPRGPLEAAKIFTRSSIDMKLLHVPGKHVYQTNYNAWQFEHFGVQGWLVYYCLTGEEYALEGARELAEGLRLSIPGWSQRAQGRAITVFTSLFEITGEPAYLDSAMEIVHRHRGAQGFRGELWSLHAFVWQLAFIADGTGRYCLAARMAGRQDRVAEKFLTDLLDFFTENCWEPRRNKDGSLREDGDGAMAYYWYLGGVPSNNGSDGPGGDQSFLFANAYGYAFLLTGNQKYWEMAVKTGRHFRCTGNKNFHWRLGQAYLAQVQGATPQKQYPDRTPPAAVRKLRAAWASNYDIGLRWEQASDNRGVVGYRVYRSNEADFPTNKQTLIASPQYEDFVDHNVVEGARLHYKVTAIDMAGNEGPVAETLSLTVPGNVPPLMTAALAACPRAKAILLIWRVEQTEGDVVGARIYRGLAPGGAFKQIAYLKERGDAHHVDRDVEIGKRYYYRITQVDKGGLESMPSQIVSAVPAAETRKLDVRINMGGERYQDRQGNVWEADAETTNYMRIGKSDVLTTKHQIKECQDQPLYGSARTASANAPNSTFRFKVPNGRYEITLLFAGIAGQQVTANAFDVHINGRKVLEKANFAGGLLTASKVRLSNINVVSENLDIEFWCRAGRYEVSGIAIEGETPTMADDSQERPIRSSDASRKVIAVNCGGKELTDADGVKWLMDKKFDGVWGYLGNCTMAGQTPKGPHKSVYQSFLTPDPLHIATIPRVTLPGFPAPKLEKRIVLVHGSELAYSIKAPNGTYRVSLHFLRDRAAGQALNHRSSFDIVLENRRVWQNLDMFWVRTGNECVKTFEGVTINDGNLSVLLLSNFGNIYPPKLCGIMLERLDEK